MLVIRTDQLHVLADSRLQQFEVDIAAHLRARFPSASCTATIERSREFVRESVRIAKGFGITQAYELRRFTELRVEYGENVHLLDWAAQILNDPTLSGCGKMERIDDYSLYVLR